MICGTDSNCSTVKLSVDISLNLQGFGSLLFITCSAFSQTRCRNCQKFALFKFFQPDFISPLPQLPEAFFSLPPYVMKAFNETTTLVCLVLERGLVRYLLSCAFSFTELKLSFLPPACPTFSLVYTFFFFPKQRSGRTYAFVFYLQIISTTVWKSP